MDNPPTRRLEQTEQKLRRLEQRLTVQSEAGRILSQAESLASAAPDLLRAVCEGVRWDLGQLWIVDRQVNKLRWIACWHRDSFKLDEFVDASRTRFFSHGAGLPGRVWDSGAPEWIDEIANDRVFPRVTFAVQAQLNSAFGFPVKVGNEVSAVIEFFSAERQSNDDSLLELMSGIGNQIGQFVE